MVRLTHIVGSQGYRSESSLMIWGLRIFAGLVLAGMLIVTTIASLDRGVLAAGAELWPDPWFKATLADAYFGFLTVFLWIAYKEPGLGRRLLWLVLLLTLGNIAIAAYLMLQTFKLRPGDPVEKLLLRSQQ
jgi:hypothetical protein